MDSVIADFQKAAQKALEHLKHEYAKLQTGVANAALVENINVVAYGSEQPLKAVASISIPEPRTIRIQPWDKGVLKDVETAITKADLGLAPSNTGDAVILSIPPLTEERRKELVKVVKRLAEEAKVVARQARKDAHNQFKQLEDSGDFTEDDHRAADKRLQEKVDQVNADIDELASHKETSVMTV